MMYTDNQLQPHALSILQVAWCTMYTSEAAGSCCCKHIAYIALNTAMHAQSEAQLVVMHGMTVLTNAMSASVQLLALLDSKSPACWAVASMYRADSFGSSSSYKVQISAVCRVRFTILGAAPATKKAKAWHVSKTGCNKACSYQA
eukprot:GHRR01013102.1.p3 GENE.GHRR01013102.1~~GHRR01013102.1.p3  ORF type:complete len:145 (+),score=38.46 GHRR01013102.1:1461-1895(+)